MCAMMLEEQDLLFCEKNSEEERKVSLHADKTANVQVLLEAPSSFFSEPHLSALLAKATEVAQTFEKGRFEGLCHLDLIVDAPDVCF